MASSFFLGGKKSRRFRNLGDPPETTNLSGPSGAEGPLPPGELRGLRGRERRHVPAQAGGWLGDVADPAAGGRRGRSGELEAPCNPVIPKSGFGRRMQAFFR